MKAGGFLASAALALGVAAAACVGAGCAGFASAPAAAAGATTGVENLVREETRTQDAPVLCTVRSDGTPLYVLPDPGAPESALLSRGDTFRVEARRGGWVTGECLAGGPAGWILLDPSTLRCSRAD